jgi:hypothetical protein
MGPFFIMILFSVMRMNPSKPQDNVSLHLVATKYTTMVMEGSARLALSL